MAAYEDDVKALKEWYSKQPHLPQNIDVEYFYNFVTGTKSLEKAKQKIDGYFSLRKDVVDLFKGVGLGTEAFRNHVRVTKAAILPGKTPEGYKVIFTTNWADADMEAQNSGSQYIRLLLLLEIGLNLCPTDTSYVFIHDGRNVPLSVIKTLDLRHFQGLGKLLLKGLPIKMKKFYLIQKPGFLDKIISLIRAVLSKKLNERISIVHDDAVLEKTLPKSMIPSEYGGDGQSLEEMDAYWNEQLLLRQKWFEEKMKLVSDETKRPKDTYNQESLDFGLDGSFKSLTID